MYIPRLVPAPTLRSVLLTLSKARILELARAFSVAVSPSATKELQADALAASRIRFAELVNALGRDELKVACRSHGLEDAGRARLELAARLLRAFGADDVALSTPPSPSAGPGAPPESRKIVRVRHRKWLVEEVTPPLRKGDGTLVRLVCLDDDNQGRVLEVIWELELGATVLEPEAHGLGAVTGMDPPRHFAAYLHAIKWNCVTATDAKLFQSPFRAGIKLMNHQLTPLRKALSLPRANLFIADDVGLGKTIEAGLVASELLLRQRVELILIVCPASVCLQWRDEMQKKFGLHFEVMNRAFVGQRRKERGFGVNPWSTHTRFIISHPLLRRPEYRDPLLAHLGERAPKSLLILDEAHVAAPASSGQYAVDSKITDVIRDIAPRFENRLFLSATPHNGHSNSFSALLEILDRQRFTRGVPVRDKRLLDAVMVRRLKEDLRQLGVEQFPKRLLVRIPVGSPASPEIALASMLAAYTELMKPERGRGGLVFINLQKRLLSSVDAFYRTLGAHQRALGENRTKTKIALPLPVLGADDDEYGVDDEVLDQADEAEAFAASHELTPQAQAQSLLEELSRLAKQARGAPDAKVEALLAWIQKNQCPAVRAGGPASNATKADRAWTDRRVLIFTEYGDTKRYLRTLLDAAVEGTDRGDARILELHGGMSDEQREEVQRAFNGPPDQHPVRILLATDAAREGVNLQGHCADLFHFDVPWNPARLEQRNGRIDRAMQPSPEVRCHYFVYEGRTEDLVLDKLIEKVDTIRRELGSLGKVLLERIEEVMERGIDKRTALALDTTNPSAAWTRAVSEELEPQRIDPSRIKAEINEAGRILNSSRKVMEFDPVLLRDAIDVGLSLAGAGNLVCHPGTDSATEAWTLPELPEAWQDTLDSLRPARGRDEPFWEFRKKPPLPIVFRPPAKMSHEVAHVHLQHPLVQRILGRFLSQGYSAHDLSRVTVVRTRHDSLVRVIAFGRLSLFGHGATRLHDQLLAVAAPFVEGKEDALVPSSEDEDRKAIETLEQVLAEAPTLDAVSGAVQAKLSAVAPKVFASLFPHVLDEADAALHEAERKLALRATEESEALEEILKAQRESLEAEQKARSQLSFADLHHDKREQEQWRKENEYMDDRLKKIEDELKKEPAQIKRLYEVTLHRVEPVGLVFLYPETLG